MGGFAFYQGEVTRNGYRESGTSIILLLTPNEILQSLKNRKVEIQFNDESIYSRIAELRHTNLASERGYANAFCRFGKEYPQIDWLASKTIKLNRDENSKLDLKWKHNYDLSRIKEVELKISFEDALTLYWDGALKRDTKVPFLRIIRDGEPTTIDDMLPLRLGDKTTPDMMLDKDYLSDLISKESGKPIYK